MRSICKFAYAAVLGLSMFTIQPTLEEAEAANSFWRQEKPVPWNSPSTA
jgi:hypothetical protein